MKLAVLGAGSWGTALASLFAEDNDTILWARDPGLAEEVTANHRNPRYLPDYELCPSLRATGRIGAALEGAEAVVVAVPSPYLRAALETARPFIDSRALLVSVSKGIEMRTGARMSEVIIDVLGAEPDQVAVLSGPNLAREVMSLQPSATVLACTNPANAALLQAAMTTGTFRVFTNSDVIGCEVGGAIKNVIAIAAGIGDGLGYGWNTKAALLTRGLAEMARFGVALGANPITFLGLSGHGDLTATCSSPQSRNRHVGEQLGRGRSVDEITGEMHMVAEGIPTTPALIQLAHRWEVPMPITRNVGAVLDGSLSPDDAVQRLMRYEPGSELDDLA